MSPLRTALLVAALGALMFAGCTGTTYYAVLTSRSPSDGGRCFDDCRQLRSATQRYLACMRRCPGAEVYGDTRCVNMSFHDGEFACTTEQQLSFSALEVIVGIVIGVMAFGLLYFRAFYLDS